MDKKDILKTVGVLNEQYGKRRVGRPVTQNKVIAKTSQKGTKEDETRATFIVNETLLSKIKALAYWHRQDIKDVVRDAFQDKVNKYEKINGPIKSIPVKK